MISTTFHDTFTKDQVRNNVAAATPLRREGNAAEVADPVAFLASLAVSFLTGTSVDINGGGFFPEPELADGRYSAGFTNFNVNRSDSPIAR